jgi:hypothetical protein
MDVAERRPAGDTPQAARAKLREFLDRSLPSSRPETVERLLETARVRTVRPGGHIYRQGEPVPLTLILDGYGAARRRFGLT